MKCPVDNRIDKHIPLFIVGTFIMQIEGEDADEDGTENAKMAYRIIKQEPKGHGDMFTLDRHTGKLYVKQPTLDREVSGRCISLTMLTCNLLAAIMGST